MTALVISLNAYRAARSIGASDLERTAERIERRVQELRIVIDNQTEGYQRIAIRGVDVMEDLAGENGGIL